ncbi:hypothetical protein G7069_09180 [Lysobacter sp. HDW10]|uniref:hypothetical protein n=1 Tax=Lysobacter sp. HDW10 TaxID=2714936 RepID=UPI00140DF444|nr:hypothetical protein [Lysobacter sp. HDW10]QIK81750.1 hypothetical protein G7069_09180 [Lysobacter sp. HDW10]
MATKRTMKPSAEKSAPLRRLSAKEKGAHDATGYWWGEGTVRYDTAKTTLKRHRVPGEVALALLGGLIDHVGRYQMANAWLAARLTPTEIVAQARMTADIAADLADRIRYMEPNLAAHVSALGNRATKDVAFAESGLEYLTRVQVYCMVAAQEIERMARKTVTNRTFHRDRLLAEVDAAISKQLPEMQTLKRCELAADLMACWGIEVSQDVGELRKQIKRGK